MLYLISIAYSTIWPLDWDMSLVFLFTQNNYKYHGKMNSYLVLSCIAKDSERKEVPSCYKFFNMFSTKRFQYVYIKSLKKMNMNAVFSTILKKG